MNILIVVPYYAPNIVGGAEVSCQIMAEGLAKYGHCVTVLTLGIEKEDQLENDVTVSYYYDPVAIQGWRKSLTREKIPLLLRIAINWGSILAHRNTVRWYTEFFRNRHFDVAIINSNEELMQRASLWKALEMSRIPTILTLRDPVLVDRNWGNLIPIYRRLVQHQAQRIQCYAAPSRFIFSIYEKAGFQMLKKKVIYNTVDIPQRKPEKKEQFILYVGAIAPYKGVLTLLNATDILHDRLGKKDFRLVLIGRNDLPDTLVQRRDVVRLQWMPREQVYEYMHKAKVVVLPSEWKEAFGRVLIEAVYNGTLAVGSSAGAIPELFEGDERYVFPQKNAEELADRLERIFHLREYEYNLEVNDMQRKWKKFSVENYVSQWESYCIEAINDEKKGHDQTCCYKHYPER